MRILVTGATGFVGSHSLDALSGLDGIDPVAACRDSTRLPPGFSGEVRTGDLRDPRYAESVTEGIDTVIHAAAWTALWGHADRSDELFLQPSLRLAAAAQRQGVRRFVFISTISAAAPQSARDPLSPGVRRRYWPHEANVVRIEDRLRVMSGPDFGAVILRLGLFAGARYGLGLLPILVPRLKTRLVPWVAGGRTGLPITDGRDVGAGVALAATATGLGAFESYNLAGPTIPTTREVLTHLHEAHDLPLPLFSVPFPAAFAFGWLMEKLDPLVPWEPLVTRSIVHLLQETRADNTRAERDLGYVPQHHWKQAVDRQMAEMARKQATPMSMARPHPGRV